MRCSEVDWLRLVQYGFELLHKGWFFSPPLGSEKAGSTKGVEPLGCHLVASIPYSSLGGRSGLGDGRKRTRPWPGHVPNCKQVTGDRDADAWWA